MTSKQLHVYAPLTKNQEGRLIDGPLKFKCLSYTGDNTVIPKGFTFTHTGIVLCHLQLSQQGKVLSGAVQRGTGSQPPAWSDRGRDW